MYLMSIVPYDPNVQFWIVPYNDPPERSVTERDVTRGIRKSRRLEAHSAFSPWEWLVPNNTYRFYFPVVPDFPGVKPTTKESGRVRAEANLRALTRARGDYIFRGFNEFWFAGGRIIEYILDTLQGITVRIPANLVKKIVHI